MSTSRTKSTGSRFQNRVAVLSGAGMFLDGFDVSVIAVALPGLKAQWEITGTMEGIVAGSAIIGMFLGMLFGGKLTDTFGRRKMYMIDLSGFIIFALLAAFTQNVWQLIATRFLLGLFIGADYPISSSITAEFTAPERRGRFIIFMSLLWQAGAFFAYLTGIAMFPIGASAWRWMLGLGALLAAIVLVLRHDVPESPRWLRQHGRIEEANAIMANIEHLQGNYFDNSSEKAARAHKGTSALHGTWWELFSPHMIRSTIFCCTFWFAFAVSFYGIQMYTPSILKPFTGGNPVLAYVGSSVIALLGVLGAAIGMVTVEKIGRRKQILWCFVGMVIVLATLALIQNPSMIVLIVLLSSAILLANLGPGVLNMVYPNELFPTRLRASGVGFAGSISRIGAILGVTVFPIMVSKWGMANSTWLFAGVAIFGLIISFFMAPETQGKSLEELEELANNGWKEVPTHA
ncbi:MFS transporter [Schaalia sp. lx-260]|uniref:MFS transporter n=1 Tax=Schaalia sp. lx-260 TaxID=2899082 RepID=UPI001E415739|nr:MFS transporter [Schaalia sp. lx-260]MCD4548964.1 sugar porter family MFS transporter [Schaalia sp. lx-260]